MSDPNANITITDIIRKFTTQVINPAIVLLFGVATLVFAWGVVTYVLGNKGGDQKKLDAGKQMLLWGIIGMFVMASAWGIVRILCDFFDTCVKTGLF